MGASNQMGHSDTIPILSIDTLFAVIDVMKNYDE